MPINDVLPLKAARRDVIPNLQCFWGLGHQRPNFDGYIYIHYAAPPYSARISAIYFFPFFNVWLGSVSACNAWEAQCRIYERWLRTLIVFYAVCGPKFMTFWDDVGDHSQLSTHLTDCLYRVLFQRYRPLKLPLSCEVVQKMVFGPPICRGRG